MSNFCRGCVRCHNNIAGSGICLLTPSNKFVGEYDFVFVKDHGGKYNDFGGKSEGMEAVHVACKELYEESRGTISVNPMSVSATRFVDVGNTSSGFRHIYRCYIMIVNDVSCSAYYRVNTSYLPHEFRETTRMTRFPMRHVEEMMLKHNFHNHLYDDEGKLHLIDDRLRRVLQLVFN